MPLLKPISGHTGCSKIKKYLEKGGRAQLTAFLNFGWEVLGEFHNLEETPAGFDWAASMDATRHDCGNDTPYRGKPARTFKHFVISPDPKDGLNSEQVMELAQAWTLKHFHDFEATVIIHDDNEGHIPHAHVVVNNTNVITEHRLQTPDPLALNRSLQDLAQERGFRFMSNRMEKEQDDIAPKKLLPTTLQQTYLRRAEKEIAKEGGYSWVTDIRNRVTVAKGLARNQGEFMAVLNALDIDVTENSPKSWRRDWIYSLRDNPTWRVSGEKLGLSFGKEALTHRFERRAAWHPSAEASRETLSHARDAIALNNLADLKKLATCMETCMARNLYSIEQLDRRITKLEQQIDGGKEKEIALLKDTRDYVANNRLLPQKVRTAPRRNNTQHDQRNETVRKNKEMQPFRQPVRQRERSREIER